MPINNLFVLFCEDIRAEVDGKVSYIGVLGSGLVVDSFPATLPKLCVGLGAEMEGAEKVNVTCELTTDLDAVMPAPFSSEAEPAEGNAGFWNLRVNMAFANMPVNKAGFISVRVRIDNVETVSTLRIFTGNANMSELASYKEKLS